MLGGRLPFDITTPHEQFGEAVGIAPDMLSFIAPGSWKDIYGHAAARSFQKWGYSRTKEGIDHMLCADDEDHARQCRLVNLAFFDKALKGQESIVTGHIDDMTHQLQQRAEGLDGGVASLTQWLDFKIFHIIGDLAFGVFAYCLKNGSYHPWISLLFSFIRP